MNQETPYLGRELRDEDGNVLGKICEVRPDAAGGWWLAINHDCDDPARSALAAFHSDDLEDREGALHIRGAPVPPRSPDTWVEGAGRHWTGRAVLDPFGVRLGHVKKVTPDGTGGAWIELLAEWGVLDWLESMGAAERPRFTFHSNDFEEQGSEALRLKKSILEYGEGRRAA